MTQLLTEPTLTINEHGTHDWRLNGVHHRLDGPARIWSKPYNGEEWIVNGRYHRVGGPARIFQESGQYWYVNGELHRVDGPAWLPPEHGWWKESRRWYVHDHHITDKIEAWMAAKDVSWPWDESTQVEFCLTWC